MQNKNEDKKFLWGNYNYSNEISKDIISNIPKEEPEHAKDEEKNDKNFFSPIKTKIKEGIEKITKLELSKKSEENLPSKNQSEYLYDFRNNESLFEYEEDFQIKCIIDEYIDKVIGKDHVIFYKIELSSSLSGKNWEVFRSLKEFSDLYLIYQKLFLDVPIIKWPNLSTIRKEPIIHRQLINQLNSFMNEILEKPGLLTAPFLIDFLELKNHNNDLTIYKPILRYDSNFDEMYSNNLCINDVLYLEEPKLLLIGTGLLEGEVINNNNEITNEKSGLFGNIKKLGSKIFSSNKEIKANTCKGKFFVYNLIKNNNLELMLVELKNLEVISQIIKIDFFPEKNIIILGLNNGQILIFELFIQKQNPNSQDIIEYIGTINYHANPILCCLFNFKEGYIYSFAKYETNIKICEFNYQTLKKDFSIYNNIYKKSWKNKGIISVDYTISYEYIYIQDEEGNIFFIDIISDVLNPYIICFFQKFIKNSNENNKGKIIQIKNSFYLFISENAKDKLILNIYLILINEYNNNNGTLINLIKTKEINLNGNIFITNIRITSYFFIIISLSNGTICIYNHSNKYPEYYFIYHHQKLTNFIWVEKQKTIISVSHDRSIKIYQIPLKWPAELIRKNKIINKLNIIIEMITDVKYIFSEMSYNNIIENKEEEQDIKDKNENEKLNKQYNWNIGNLNENISEEKNSSNSNLIKNDINYSENKIKNLDINVTKNDNSYLNTYLEYYNIFSDDLDGWSL